MARYSSGVKTSAGSTTLPLASVYAGTSVAPKLREWGVFNTTATALDVKLVRLTTFGTAGAAQTVAKHDYDSGGGSATFQTTHSGAAPALGNDLGYRASIPAAIGGGVIWTFGDTGLRIPTGTANGIGLIIENGTGQVLQTYAVWDE